MARSGYFTYIRSSVSDDVTPRAHGVALRLEDATIAHLPPQHHEKAEILGSQATNQVIVNHSR